MILLLFTASYPYALGSERTFLRMELPYLLDSFERVILVPEKRETDSVDDEIGKIEIENSYAEQLRAPGSLNTFLRGLSSRLVFKEIWSKPWLLVRPIYLKRLLFFAGQAELTRAWAIDWIRSEGVQPRECLCYTYWFDQSALGVGLAKETFPDLKVVSRAHGYDVYEDRRSPPYWPCRQVALEVVDRVYPDSDAGTEYLCDRYPGSTMRVKTARLGVPDPVNLTKSSSDGEFRIVSCSRILPVKRVGLILEGITAAAHLRPAQKFQWHHFGTGPLDAELEEARRNLPPNFTAIFGGYSTQAELFRFYRDNPVDVFVNASTSEGTPVAVIEAISCGIPAIATKVGGNKEVVSDGNGYLLSPNPTVQEVAEKLLCCLDDPGDRRAGSRELWSRNYDADRNYPAFVKDLIEIRQ